MSFLNPFRSTPAKAAAPTPGRADAPARGNAGTPLELIKYDQSTGKFHLGEEAVAVLQNVSPAPRCFCYSPCCNLPTLQSLPLTHYAKGCTG